MDRYRLGSFLRSRPATVKLPFLQAFRTPEVGWDLLVNKNVCVEQVLPAAMVRVLTGEEMDHYREPFKDPSSGKPVWRWPNELPDRGRARRRHAGG